MDEHTTEDLREATQDVGRRCQGLADLLEQVLPQLAALQDAPTVTVDTAAQKARHAVGLMRNLAGECAEQLHELVEEVRGTAAELWPEGTEVIDDQRSAIDSASNELEAALPVCEQAFQNASTSIAAHADALEQVAVTLDTQLLQAMQATVSGAQAMLPNVEASIQVHADFIEDTNDAVGVLGDALARTTNDELVVPLSRACETFAQDIDVLCADFVEAPLGEARAMIAGVVVDLGDGATSCLSQFDEAVAGFCDELAGRGDGVSTKSRATQELTGLVKPIFEDIVERVPGVKSIADIVGVGL